jgi:alkylation response protein AidB-like acyl-CoA dehydrogenase
MRTDVAAGTAMMAEFVAHAAVSARACDAAALAFKDTIGVTLAGSREPAAQMAQRLAAEEGVGPCRVLGTGIRTSAQAAAFANGIAAHALDFDDMCFVSLAHPSCALVPAALATGELVNTSPAHLLDAYVIGFEAERINVAARGLGLARAAFEEAIRYAQQRVTFGTPIAQHQSIQIKLADMATKIEASRLLIYSAAAKKDRGERCDVEAGMAKLFATETAAEVTLEAMRIMGGNGYSKDFTVERLYRDAPLVVIGGGTNELQRLIIAKGLLERYRDM